MHLLYTHMFLHRKHFNSICIQTTAELKDSATIGPSTKNTQKISVADCTVELISDAEALHVASSLQLHIDIEIDIYIYIHTDTSS